MESCRQDSITQYSLYMYIQTPHKFISEAHFLNSFFVLIHLLNLHEVGRQMHINVRFAYLVLRIGCSFSKRGTTAAFAVGHCRLFILQGLQLQPAAHLVHFVHRCKLQWCKIRVQDDVYLTWEFPEGLHGVFGPWTEPGQAFKVCFLQVRALPALLNPKNPYLDSKSHFALRQADYSTHLLTYTFMNVGASAAFTAPS